MSSIPDTSLFIGGDDNRGGGGGWGSSVSYHEASSFNCRSNSPIAIFGRTNLDGPSCPIKRDLILLELPCIRAARRRNCHPGQPFPRLDQPKHTEPALTPAPLRVVGSRIAAAAAARYIARRNHQRRLPL